MKKSFFALAAMFFAASAVMAQTTFYVSATTGGNKKAGTSADMPLKNIQKAIDKASAGDVIKVAEGNYFGTLDCGAIIVDKEVTIEGGYSTDFKERNVLKHPTTIMPTAASNGTVGSTNTLGNQGTMVITIKSTDPYNNARKMAQIKNKVRIDGLIFDRGNSIAYRVKADKTDAGWPDGIETPMMQPIGTEGKSGVNLEVEKVFTVESAEIYLANPQPTYAYALEIENCAFLNAPNYGIRGNFYGKATIKNNIFVNVRMAAVEIPGSNANEVSEIRFSYNTVLFCWSRKKDLEDMGYGYRYMTGAHSYVDHNIIGCTTFAGLDRTRIDSNKTKENARQTHATNNMFFLNRQADLTLPGGGMYQRIWNNQFDDVDQLQETDGNKDLDAKALKGVIDEKYLDEFLHINYTETASVDRNSAANQFRAAMGMNIQGTISSKVTMFANRYNHDKALKFFGAVAGYGAQQPK